MQLMEVEVGSGEGSGGDRWAGQPGARGAATDLSGDLPPAYIGQPGAGQVRGAACCCSALLSAWFTREAYGYLLCFASSPGSAWR